MDRNNLKELIKSLSQFYVIQVRRSFLMLVVGINFYTKFLYQYSFKSRKWANFDYQQELQEPTHCALSEFVTVIPVLNSLFLFIYLFIIPHVGILNITMYMQRYIQRLQLKVMHSRIVVTRHVEVASLASFTSKNLIYLLSLACMHIKDIGSLVGNYPHYLKKYGDV